MRTTARIDDDVLAAARQVADSERITLGEALSALARAGLTKRPDAADRRSGILLLPAKESARRVTLEDVNALRDESS